MILKKRIPEGFYKLFRTRNMDAYMQFLVAIYEENNEIYTSLGLTIEECRAIISEMIAKQGIFLQEDELEEQEDRDGQLEFAGLRHSPAAIVTRLIHWGWMRKEFDDRLNQYVIGFPEYSQLYIELFEQLYHEDDSRERESILAIYSALYTYQSDKDKNNDILINAVRTCKRLGQMLSNMQDGMRAYFDELSSRKNFIGIQEVLVEEINNSDSKKYAILTTSDSFYRYKESVKELISDILSETEVRKETLLRKQQGMEPESAALRFSQMCIRDCEEASGLVYHIEREFDRIERKYNKLIEQKSVFAKRALARIQYIMQEGADNEDNIVNLIGLLNRSADRENILRDLSGRMGCTTQYKIWSDRSLFTPRGTTQAEFAPVTVEKKQADEQEIADFVPKPLYTRKELDDFRRRNQRDGAFVATKDTVRSIEDLEKLLFLWQEATGNRLEEDRVAIGEEIQSEDGYTYSGLVIADNTNKVQSETE